MTHEEFEQLVPGDVIVYADLFGVFVTHVESNGDIVYARGFYNPFSFIKLSNRSFRFPTDMCKCFLKSRTDANNVHYASIAFETGPSAGETIFVQHVNLERVCQ